MQNDSKNKGRVLAIDYGSKRVGVAVSDPLRVIARGLDTLANDAALLEHLAAMVRDEAVVRIVVGIPYAADGGVGAKAREVQAFMARLREVVAVPIDTWDESYTSVRAHETFRAAGMRKKQRRQKARVDEMAARLMLQEYLESSVG